jgi:hypothetical protein
MTAANCTIVDNGTSTPHQTNVAGHRGERLAQAAAR